MPAAASGMTPSESPVEGEHLELRRDVVGACTTTRPPTSAILDGSGVAGAICSAPVPGSRDRISTIRPGRVRGFYAMGVAQCGDDVRVEIAHDEPSAERRRRVECLEASVLASTR